MGARFHLDPESGFVLDALTGEWLTTAEEVFTAVYPLLPPDDTLCGIPEAVILNSFLKVLDQRLAQRNSPPKDKLDHGKQILHTPPVSS